jgi:hypothetical protein
MNPLLQYWYFHLPNFLLAAVMYTALGRLLLSNFVAPDWPNYIWRMFKRITDPFIRIVKIVTPFGVPDVLILIFTILWLMVLRVVFFMVMSSFGLLPSIGGV